jgi:succinate dehydrogenase / fumarate reductase, membrane anchor subunit
MSTNNIGPKRLVVGAHYGLKEWIIQRITAVVMVVFTVVLLVAYLISGGASYEAWAGLFSNQLMKLLTFLTFLSLFYHAWIGIRDIWMDYVKVACAAYAAEILWKV